MGDRKDWRELCAAAASETDSEKLAGLVQEIINALDQRKPEYAVPHFARREQ